VEGNRATGVETPVGFHPADLVLVNADYPFAELHLLDAKHRTYDEGYWEDRVLAPSAFVAYVGTDRTFPKLAHHTLFLEKDWADSFDQVFDPEKATWPTHPSYYVNVPSRTDPTAAPAGCDSLFILVPLSPFLREEPGQRERFFNRIMDHLEEQVGEPIRKHIVTKRIFALEDFRERYNAFHGTALSLSHTLFQTALWRPAHKSKKVQNLYYTGQYTHPGIGIPMVLISSTIVARELTGSHR
jgi:phytoene desaturase